MFSLCPVIPMYVPCLHRHFFRLAQIQSGFWWSLREVITAINWWHFGRHCTRDKGAGYDRKFESTSNRCFHVANNFTHFTVYTVRCICRAGESITHMQRQRHHMTTRRLYAVNDADDTTRKTSAMSYRNVQDELAHVWALNKIVPPIMQFYSDIMVHDTHTRRRKNTQRYWDWQMCCWNHRLCWYLLFLVPCVLLKISLRVNLGDWLGVVVCRMWEIAGISSFLARPVYCK